MKIVSNARMRELKTAENHLHRVVVANRWLSEFDWMLEPLWDFLGGKSTISDAREEIRVRIEARDASLGVKK